MSDKVLSTCKGQRKCDFSRLNFFPLLVIDTNWIFARAYFSIIKTFEYKNGKNGKVNVSKKGLQARLQQVRNQLKGVVVRRNLATKFAFARCN